MFNVAIINIKDILKYLVKIIIILLIIFTITRYFNFEKKDSKINISKLNKNALTYCLDVTIPDIINEKDNNKNEILQEILGIELSMAENIMERTDLNINVEELTIDDKDELVEEIIQENIETEIVQENNIETRFTNNYGAVEIRNESDYELTEEMITPNFELTDKTNVIIFQTHTCESYTPTENFNYVASGNYRTTDLNFSVARVGTEFGNYLKEYGFNVINDQTYHDFPAYSGSYNRSLTTVENILKNNKAEMIFDIHRDAIGDNTYAPKVKIGEEYAAQLTFVIGTDGGGLEHPNWLNNLKFAIKVQEKANELYPGLFRPIILRNSRYNQHLSNAASIIEVGATGNTTEEAIISMKYLAKVISEIS